MAEKDFIDIAGKTNSPKEAPLAEIRKIQQEFTKKHEPYDFRNAVLALEDYYNQWTKEVQRAISNRQEPPKFKTSWDWYEYGNINRFEKVSESKVIDQNAKTGMASPTHTGYMVDYRVKGKNNGISVFVPLDVWNERNTKK
jgi:hypothetical protein